MATAVLTSETQPEIKYATSGLVRLTGRSSSAR